MRYYLVLFSLLLILSSAFAIDAGITAPDTANSGEITAEITAPEIVNEDEDVSFSFAITSTLKQTVEFMLRIQCDSGPVDFLDIQTAEVDVGTPYYGSRSLGKLNYKWWETGECTATVTITKPIEQKFTKTFRIVVAPNLKVETDSYGLQDATENKRVFILGETVWIKSTARANTGESVNDITFTVNVELNNQLVKTLKGASVSFIPTAVGYYTYRVTASANGFKDGDAVVRTTFVAKHYTPSIVQTPACNQNGVCDAGESVSSCAWDCPLSTPVVSDDPFTQNLAPEPKTAPIAPTTQKATSIGTALGRAVCIFDGICASALNFGVIAAAIAIIIGILFLKMRKNKGAVK